jgi:hypothetical protein
LDSTLLTVIGLLLVATSLTLLVFSSRSWLVAFAQGFGIQGLVGACISGIYVGYLQEQKIPTPLAHRIEFAIQGIPFHAIGWTGRTAYNSAFIGSSGPPAVHLDQFLPIAAIQLTFIAAIFALRKMRPAEGTDLIILLLFVGLVVNAGANIYVRWWN